MNSDAETEAPTVRAVRRAPRFKLRRFDELIVGPEPTCLVEGLIPRVGVTVAWGPPKSGKSFWVFDLAMHVALNRGEYRDRRVHPGPVVYCAFEGAYGFNRRAEAFRIKHPEDRDRVVPFYLLGLYACLEHDHPALIADIRAQLPEQPPACVVLDTLNRSLGGAENDTAAMTGYVSGAEAISNAFGCAVIAVHHCGHDESRMRGASSLAGNVECQISIRRETDGTIVATVVNAKDMPDGAAVASRLVQVELGLDRDGVPISSCVIEPAEVPLPTKKDKKRLSLTQELAMRCLDDLVKGSNGKPLPSEWDQPAGLVGAPATAWRKALESRGDLDAKDRRARKKFHELKNALKKKNAIAEQDGIVWMKCSASTC
jgi:hypothetical protein